MGHRSEQGIRQERRGAADQRETGEHQDQHRQAVPARLRPGQLRYRRKGKKRMAGHGRRMQTAIADLR